MAQGYTHVFSTYESGSDFEKDILEKTRCSKSREEAIEAICSERRIPVEKFENIEDKCFIWDLAEELSELTAVCTRDREAGNVIEYFTTVGEAQQAINDYEASDKEEGIFVPDFYEIAYRKGADYVKY